MMTSKQPGLAFEAAPAGMSMEWDARGHPQALWARLFEHPGEDIIIGLGEPLLTALGAKVDDLKAFAPLVSGRLSMPSTQHALWTLVLGASMSDVFESADRLRQRLAPVARLAECTTLFSYRGGHDLTGYKDGSANPQAEEAWQAALIPDGPWASGSFALVQRYLHFRDRFEGLAPDERDLAVGRRFADDAELDTAPATAHIKRAEQKDCDPPAFMLRRSMPWGDARRHGLHFIALMSDLSKAERILGRMIGAADGTQDALLAHTQAETGAFYFIPPLAGDHLKLPDVQPADLASPSEEVVATEGVRLKVDSSKCIHSRNCVLTRPDVFVPNVQGPWLHPEVATVEDVVEIAHQCPSGAIRYERLDGGPQEKKPMRNLVRLRENGPYAIHGDFEVAGERHLRATLCRCGRSRRKPYCDGSHGQAAFAASGEAAPINEPWNAFMPEAITIQPVADGPLVVHGAVEIVSGTGKTISRAPGPNLCRCGHSANKPFCDGSHARVGFRAPD